jgi:hypothetical protein
MGASARPEAVAEAEEVGFIDGAQHLGDRALDNLVLQRGNAKGPSPTIGFRNVAAANRLRPISPRVHTITKVPDVTLQGVFVSLHRHSIDPGAGHAPLSPKCASERGFVDMVQ